MKYLPLAIISFLTIILSVFLLSTDMGITSKASNPVSVIQYEELESILGDTQETRISIQYTTVTEPQSSLSNTTIAEPITIQVLHTNSEHITP